MRRTKGNRKRARATRFDVATVSGRYVPVMARGECGSCGHWAILTGGVCSDCRGGAADTAVYQRKSDAHCNVVSCSVDPEEQARRVGFANAPQPGVQCPHVVGFLPMLPT
jgi:hypothetical protein